MSIIRSKDDDQTKPLTRDQIFDILSNGRRRFILQYLESTEGKVRLMDLVTAAAAWEYDTPRSELTRAEKKRMYVSLHQAHLPKLSRADLIEYNKNRSVVAAGPRLEAVMPYLSADDTGRNWWQYYLILTCVNAGILSTSVLAGPGALTEFVLLPFIAISYAALAAAHFIATSRHPDILTQLAGDGFDS